MSDSAIIALEKAITFESNGLDYYQRLAEEMSDPTVKRLFALLAEAEKNHILRVREIYEELKNKPGWPALESMIARQSGTHDAFEMESLVCGGIGCDAAIIQALDKAMEMEQAGITFYRERLGQASCDAEAKFFEALVEEEVLHLEMLQKAKDEVYS